MGAVTIRTPLERLIRIALLALAALFFLAPSAGCAVANATRIVAVGDLHGDYQAWQTIASAAGLIDASGHWAGGTTTLV